MEKRTIQRLRGAVELVTDAVEAAATEAQRTHEAFARRPYAVLSRIEPIARPAKAIESLQLAITAIAFGAVRAGNAIVGAVATTAIDRLEARIGIALALAFGAALSGAALGEEPPLSPGRVALLVLEPAGASALRIETALASPEAEVRATAARVAGALAPASGCEALKTALAREKDAEAAREETRGIESLCGSGDADALQALARSRAAARSSLTVREGRGEPRPLADRVPLVRTVTDLPRGVAAGVAKETGCSLTNASLAYAEVTFRPLGTPKSINPRLMPSSEACRRAALVLFALSLPPGDYVPRAGTPDRLAVVFDADALAGIDEDPVGAPEARTVRGGVKEPRELLRVKPGYPESLRRQRLEGAAVLTARIDREGRVKDVRVVEPAGTLATVARDGTSLDLEALRAVARWRYEPARLDGAPVPVLLSVRITWAVSGFGAPDGPMMRR